MNAATEQRLEAILRAGGPLSVRQVTIADYPMTAGLVRQRMAGAVRLEAHADGVGGLMPDGTWLCTAAEVALCYQLGEDFVSRWSSPRAQEDYEAGRSTIPGMPVIRTGPRGALYRTDLLMEWLQRYFGHGYSGAEAAHQPDKGKRKGAA